MAEVRMPIKVDENAKVPVTETSSLDNSYAAREQREQKDVPPELQPVVTRDDIKPKRKSMGDRFREAIFSTDIRDVADDFVQDKVIPGILNGILDFLASCFFGGYRRRDGRRYDYSRRRDYYDDNPSYYRRERDRRDRRRDDRYEDDYRDDRRRRSNPDYRDIVLRSREKAFEVVDRLHDRIRRYGQATVGDLYKLCGYDPDWADSDVGWVDENDIGIEPVRGGYRIDVAEATSLL